jgi:hypothetical protein
MKTFGMDMLSHHNNPIEFMLELFENVYILCYLSTLFVLVFAFEIHIATCIYVVKNSTNFCKTRQNFSHQHFRFTYLLSFQLIH